MRKLVFTALGAASVVLAASPAAAQYYGQGYSYNGHNGYNGYNGYGRTGTVWSTLERRLDNVRRSLGGVRPDRAYALSSEANRLDRQIRYAARSNVSGFAARDLATRVSQLERRVAWASRDYGYNRNDRYHGYSDQDQQGRWDGNRDRNDH